MHQSDLVGQWAAGIWQFLSICRQLWQTLQIFDPFLWKTTHDNIDFFLFRLYQLNRSKITFTYKTVETKTNRNYLFINECSVDLFALTTSRAQIRTHIHIYSENLIANRASFKKKKNIFFIHQQFIAPYQRRTSHIFTTNVKLCVFQRIWLSSLPLLWRRN